MTRKWPDPKNCWLSTSLSLVVTTRPKHSARAGSKQKNAKRIKKKTSASNPTSNITTNTDINSNDVDSDDASGSHGNINNFKKKKTKKFFAGQSPTHTHTNTSLLYTLVIEVFAMLYMANMRGVC